MTEDLLTEVETFLEKDSLDVEDVERMCALANEDDDARARLRSAADDLYEQWRDDGGEDGAQNVGAALLAVGRYAEAKECFEESKRTKLGSFCLARCVYELGDYELAADLFDKAYQVSPALEEAPWLRAEALALSGSPEARGVLRGLSNAAAVKPRKAYIEGLCLEAEGKIGDAIDAYRDVVKKKPGHAKALFRLGFALDLAGEDDDAIDAYDQCIESCGPYAHALVNLGILFEDRGRFEDAIRCFKQVLARDPYNERAALFLQDARESLDMYYDEEAERRMDKRNRVLETPITDFELSVRSRNCLERINIRTLGDLTRVTEHELLGYKNFGETSLAEVRTILAQKNLRLGQAVEEPGGGVVPEGPPPIPQAILDRSIAELELSVRARRCMERLGIETVEQLISKSERDLLACKNFGQTSMSEIKQKLAALNISLSSL